MQQRIVNRGVLILLLIGITLLFLALIKPFLQAVFVAALFAALFTPLYRRILGYVGDRRGLASALTLITIILFVMVPLVLLLGTVTSQALQIADTAVPWVRQQVATPGLITQTLENLPFYDAIEPYRDQALARLGDLAALVSGWAVAAVQSITLGTFSALLSVMIVLYTLFFFLIDGDRLLYYMLYYLPLDDEDETKLLRRFTSVTRATLKGTAVIGFLQGALAGLALYFAGIPSSLFWAVAMMVLSVVPGVGTALVWLPAVIYLLVGGQFLEAIAVTLFCVVVVGTVDNLLRPKLVGNDTQLHELMIFFSTLGGLIMFGFMGFVIGPIIAALFVTLWELYGEEFRDWLPTTAFKPQGKAIALPHQSLARNRRSNRRRAGDSTVSRPVERAVDGSKLADRETREQAPAPERDAAAGSASRSIGDSGGYSGGYSGAYPADYSASDVAEDPAAAVFDDAGDGVTDQSTQHASNNVRGNASDNVTDQGSNQGTNQGTNQGRGNPSAATRVSAVDLSAAGLRQQLASRSNAELGGASQTSDQPTPRQPAQPSVSPPDSSPPGPSQPSSQRPSQGASQQPSQQPAQPPTAETAKGSSQPSSQSASGSRRRRRRRK